MKLSDLNSNDVQLVTPTAPTMASGGLKLSDLDKGDITPVTTEEPTVIHSLLNATSNPFGIEPAVQGGLVATGKALKDAVMNGKINIDDIKKNYNDARIAELAENNKAAEAHPIANFAGDLIGGAAIGNGLGMFGAGAGATADAALAAKKASYLSRLAKSVPLGAGFGAATGAGKSLSEGDDAATIGNKALQGGKFGALVGPLAETGISALKTAGSAVLGSNTAQSFAKALGYGAKGVDLSKAGGEAATSGVSDAAEALGIGARDANKSAGAEVGAAKQALSNNGSTFDLNKTIDGLKSAIKNLDTSDNVDAQADKEFYQKYLDNLTQGREQTIHTNEVIPDETIPGEPSSQDKLQQKLASLQAKENAVPKGVTGDIVPSQDDSGKPFLNLVKKLPTDKEGITSDKVATNLPDVPGTADETLPGGLGPDKSQQVRLGGIDINATPFSKAQDIKSTLTQMAGKTDAASPLKTIEGRNAAALLAKDLNTSLVANPAEGAEGPMTQLGAANQKATSSYKALNALGLDDTNFETDSLGNKIITPQKMITLSNTIRQATKDTQSGQNGNLKLQAALEHLGQVDPETANALKSQTQQAGEIQDLYQQGNGNSLTKSGILSSLPVQSGNFIGREVAPSIAAAKNAISGVVNVGGKIADASENAINAISKPLTDQDFGTAARSLVSKGTGIAMKVGSELAKGIGKDNVQKNAILFSLMQQPAYREELKSHFGNQDQQ